MPAPVSDTVTSRPLRRFEIKGERDFSVSRIAKSIASDLRSCRGKANLVLIIEAKLCADFAGALPRMNDVAF